MIDSLKDMFQLTESEAIKYLETDGFDFDKAVNKVHRHRQK
jgi:predicted RNA binding protein YcfA (HicA-like mRNA interferase family)